MVRLESGLIMKKEKSAVACTMKELVSGIKRITKRNLGSYVIATGVTERARSTNQNVHFTSSELAHLRSGTYYKEREVAQTKNGGNGSHQNTNFPSLQLLKPPCFPCLCLWRADSSSLSTIPLLAKFPPSCWEFAPSAPFHCLALWVLPSPLTSFLAAQTQQSPSNYCFPKVHILYHLPKFELLTWSILVFPPFLFLSLVCILMLCFCLGGLHEDSYWPLCLSQHPLTGVQATDHLYKPHPTNIFISLFLSAKLRAPECSPAVQKRPLTPTTTSSTCLQTPLLDILSHPQILTTKSSRTLSMLVLLSAPMFPICLTNVFTLELNTLLVTRLHTGPDQGYSKTQGQDERIGKRARKLPQVVKGQILAS